MSCTTFSWGTLAGYGQLLHARRRRCDHSTQFCPWCFEARIAIHNGWADISVFFLGGLTWVCNFYCIAFPNCFQDVSHQSCDKSCEQQFCPIFLVWKKRFLPASWAACRYTEEQSMCAGFGGLEHVHRSAHSCWTFSCAVRCLAKFGVCGWLSSKRNNYILVDQFIYGCLQQYESRVMIRCMM